MRPVTAWSTQRFAAGVLAETAAVEITEQGVTAEVHEQQWRPAKTR